MDVKIFTRFFSGSFGSSILLVITYQPNFAVRSFMQVTTDFEFDWGIV